MGIYLEEEIQECKEEVRKLNVKHNLDLSDSELNGLIWCIVNDIKLQ